MTTRTTKVLYSVFKTSEGGFGQRLALTLLRASSPPQRRRPTSARPASPCSAASASSAGPSASCTPTNPRTTTRRSYVNQIEEPREEVQHREGPAVVHWRIPERNEPRAHRSVLPRGRHGQSVVRQDREDEEGVVSRDVL